MKVLLRCCLLVLALIPLSACSLYGLGTPAQQQEGQGDLTGVSTPAVNQVFIMVPPPPPGVDRTLTYRIPGAAPGQVRIPPRPAHSHWQAPYPPAAPVLPHAVGPRQIQVQPVPSAFPVLK